VRDFDFGPLLKVATLTAAEVEHTQVFAPTHCGLNEQSLDKVVHALDEYGLGEGANLLVVLIRPQIELFLLDH